MRVPAVSSTISPHKHEPAASAPTPCRTRSCVISVRSGHRVCRSDGIPLGDTWQHPALQTDDATSGLVPFHKLSQWLAYSLIEPLQAAGIAVTDIDALTGLPEYRNGGLFVDLDALVPNDPRPAHKPTASIRSSLSNGGRLRSLCSTISPSAFARGSSSMRRVCRSPACSKAAPGPPAGASRARNAPTVRRR